MIFVDTSYFVALVDEKDRWHGRVKELSKQLRSEELVTSHLVITECVTLIGSRGGGMAGLALYDTILDNCRVLFSNKEVLEKAMDFFLDKDGGISLTDATSAALMQKNSIKKIVSFSENSDFDSIKGIERIF